MRASRSGTSLDPECDASAHKLSASAAHYLLIDTNVALHQVRVFQYIVWLCTRCMCFSICVEMGIRERG